jgi:AcrR family transcriptional regulator
VKPTTQAAAREPRRTQAERSLDTQERILVAAIEVMREHGYAGLRVADVTAAARVSRGAQTHHFRSKLELVLAMFSRMFEQASAASRQRVAAVGPQDDVIAAMIADASAFFLGKDFSLGLDMLGAGGRDPELREAVQASAKSNRFAVENLWKDLLVERGLSRENADDLLWLTFSSIRGLSVRLLWDQDLVRFERVKSLTYDAAMQLYERQRSAAAGRAAAG